ncbi:CCA tRNA nucleotidyltransferase [Anaerorhabdus furcosa]|uniref:tRNA nucleotidyltransferase (CCA-adding enzyme) n=1 Tax=Anaerorhabdus furcosa TaxID=118967 RepID=A0A1T4KEG2_9FIRM|nr:CCA tRNA nucleotidyltransferase [Anaerorhabdus furcosa]SJZ40804.1 tRNA nucleotidyltransferase (CCA-adding enzyme) [Anaerorhabdus furcosa]
MELSKGCLQSIEILNHHGYKAYLVGGAIRNYLLGKPVQDYDITTDALPINIKECFKNYKTIDIGIQHGTVAVLIDHEQIEITTFRTEKEYINHRHPKEVSFTRSLQEDCLRRDFTINAICYHPKEGFIDFFGGEFDIKNKIIKAIGNPIDRFDEDALRILRAIRFSTQLGFVIEPNTSNALFTCMDYLKSISSERIMDELTKIFLSPSCANQCFEYQDIFEVFIPELKEINFYPQKKNHVYDALTKSHPSLPIRFAILIHQCNEPDLSCNAQQIMNRLKFSRTLKLQVNTLLSSIRTNFDSKIAIKQFLQNCKIDFMHVCDFKQCIDSSFNIDTIQQLYYEIIDNQECYTLKQLAITGQDLKNLGYKDKNISLILNDILNEVIKDKLNNNKEEILKYIKM